MQKKVFYMKFKIEVTRTTTETAYIVVEAASSELAYEIAKEWLKKEEPEAIDISESSWEITYNLD